jgi:hypothetical protein
MRRTVICAGMRAGHAAIVRDGAIIAGEKISDRQLERLEYFLERESTQMG